MNKLILSLFVVVCFSLKTYAQITATQSQVNTTCNGTCNGSATVVASGGTTPYTYSWSPSGGTGASASGLCAGNYTVTISDATTASITKTFNITQPSAVTVTPVSQTNVACFGGSNGAAQVSSSGGTGSLSYNWTPGNPSGDGTGSVTGLTAQTYTVTVTDANSCSKTRTFNITQPSSPVSGSTVVTNVACFGGSNGAINLTPSGGTPGYTFNWVTGPTTEDRTGLTAGTYTNVITDANGCTGTVTATVTQPSSPVSGSTVVTNVACFGGSNGAINLTPSGGTPGYTFNWVTGQTTEDRTGLAAGTYTNIITDANGCTGTVTVTVTQPSSPVSGSTVVTNVACFGGTNGAINLTPSGGTPGYTFNWGGGVTTEDRTGRSAGTYTVVITDANGCTGTVTATVTQPSSPVSGSTVVTNVACFGGSNGAINLTPSGGTGPYTFNWVTGPTTEDRTGLAAGTYTNVITDVNGCTGTVTATVTQPSSPVSGSTVVTNVACFGGSNGAINLTPSGGTGPYTFNWVTGPTTEDRTGLAAGTYTNVITDVNGCTGTVTATVTQPSSPVSGSTVVTNVACFGGSNGAINLTPSGGTGPYTFNWVTGPTTEDRTGLTAGTYTNVITDANGCTGTVTATVTQPSSPVSGSTVVTNVACFGGSNGAINLTPSGGTGPYTFNWVTGPTTEDRTGLAAGTYTNVITDANGCTGTVTATVTQPSSPVSGSTVVTNVACFGGSSGAINLTPSGGTGPYTFNWVTGPTTEDRTGLAAGTYTNVITDVNGCTGTVTATVTQPSSPVSGSTVVTNVACFGGSSGAINLTPSGGTGPYTFNWGSGITTEDRTILVAGTYTSIITDANGCTGTVTAAITQPSASVSGTAVITNVACFNGSNGAVNLTPTGGTPGYTFDWGNGITTEDITMLAADTYTAVITDANGCTGTVTATVAQPPSPVSGTTVVTNVACFNGMSGAIDLTPAGGTAPYTFDWGSGIDTEDRTSLAANSYTVIITDANGCTATVTASVTQASALDATLASFSNVSCNGANDGSATVSASGGTGAYTYSWSPSGGTNQTASDLAPDDYTVMVTDANNCSTTVTVTITEPSALVVTLSSFNDVCADAPSFALNGGSPSGGIFSGTGVSAGNFDPAIAGVGMYQITYTYTDENGCSGMADKNITVNALPTVTLGAFSDVCLTAPAFALSGGSPSGGNYSGTAVNSGNFDPVTAGAGTHTITYTYVDANGCSNHAQEDIMVNICTGTQQQTALDNIFNVYPNPGSVNFTVTTVIENAVLEVYNSSGRMVHQEMLKGLTNTLSLEDLSAGLHTFKLQSPQGTYVRKVVVE